MTNNKTWTGTVVEEEGELLLVFSKEMLDELGWTDGDNIIWEIDEVNGAVVARREQINK